MSFYHVYADESRQDAHRYMLYGMLLVPRGAVEEAFLKEIHALRVRYDLKSEMKWAKISRGMLGVYESYVNVFFDNPDIEFRCLVVDSHQRNFRRFHDGDRETAFFNFYFYALSRNLKATEQYIVYADDRRNRQSGRWFELQAKVNYYLLGKGAHSPVVRNLQPVDSKQHDALQITDILLGAVGYSFDGLETSAHRLTFVKHVEDRVGCAVLREHRGPNTRFNIWEFRFPDEPESDESQATK